ncbi:MAG: WD repeat-containing protein jip5 [Vezdaea aestivalis]|nr:MAG: WD repeat-containing protein jip5 [Vezdaea aestivalis]
MVKSLNLKFSALYSCGLDGLVKAASASTGQVFAKWTLPTFSKSTYSPLNPESASATPDQLCALSPQTLLLSDQTGQIHLYDLRSSCPTSARPAQTHKPHSDCITSLTPLAPSGTSTSGWPKQWVSTGAGFLAVTDLRKGVSHTSEDQEDWLLSSAYVPDGGKAAGLRGDAVVVGGSTGVLTVWPRGRWEDQGARINVDTLGQGETVDAITVVSDRAQVIVGLGDGFMRVVDVKERKISYTLRHDDQEGVEALGIDVQGRLISAGGRAVKIWRQAEHAQEELARFNSKQELEEQDLNGMDGLEDSGDNEDKAAEEESEKAPKRRSKRQKNNRGNKTSDAVFAGID